MTFAFGDGTLPENLTADLDLSAKLVHFRVSGENVESGTEDICCIPLSQILLLRESLSKEIHDQLVKGGRIKQDDT